MSRLVKSTSRRRINKNLRRIRRAFRKNLYKVLVRMAVVEDIITEIIKRTFHSKTKLKSALFTLAVVMQLIAMPTALALEATAGNVSTDVTASQPLTISEFNNLKATKDQTISMTTSGLAMEISSTVMTDEYDLYKSKIVGAGQETLTAHYESLYKPLYIETNNAYVDINYIITLYRDHEKFDGKLYNDCNIVRDICINFYYEQIGLSPEIVAALIGNMLHEGVFGEQQNTYKLASNYDEYVKWLKSDKNTGYGIVQWTTEGRRKGLAQHLEKTYNLLLEQPYFTEESLKRGDDWPTLVIITELTYVLVELEGYDLFDSLYMPQDLEDATGKICLKYEGYKNSEEQWKVIDGLYKLIETDCSGERRFNSAQEIYEHIITIPLS